MVLITLRLALKHAGRKVLASHEHCIFNLFFSSTGCHLVNVFINYDFFFCFCHQGFGNKRGHEEEVSDEDDRRRIDNGEGRMKKRLN